MKTALIERDEFFHQEPMDVWLWGRQSLMINALVFLSTRSSKVIIFLHYHLLLNLFWKARRLLSREVFLHLLLDYALMDHQFTWKNAYDPSEAWLNVSVCLGLFGCCFILLGTWFIPGECRLKKSMAVTSSAGYERNCGFSKISNCSPHWQSEHKCLPLRQVSSPPSSLELHWGNAP